MISNVEDLPKVEQRRLNNDNNLGLPPASNEKLLNSSSGRLPPRRNRDMPQYNNDNKGGNEQIYSKKMNFPNNDNNSSQQENIPKNVTVEFMKPNANFVFQNMIEFHRIYTILYFIIEELLFVYKVNTFTFPSTASGLEISSLCFYLIVQLGRFYFGSLGNREENSLFILMCLIFSVGAVYTYFHFIFCQTFVLKIEYVTNIYGLFLWLIELISSLMAFISVSQQETGM